MLHAGQVRGKQKNLLKRLKIDKEHLGEKRILRDKCKAYQYTLLFIYSTNLLTACIFGNSGIEARR